MAQGKKITGNFEMMISYAKGQELACNATRTFEEDKVARGEMGAALADMGFRHFRFLGTGTYSLVLHTTDNQVVRIFDTQFAPAQRPLHPAILQPISSTPVHAGKHSFIVEVLPKVRTDNVSKEDIGMLEKVFRRSGISVHDLDLSGNVGYIRVNDRDIPVLVDAGAAKTLEDVRKERQRIMKPYDVYRGVATPYTDMEIKRIEALMAPAGSQVDLQPWLAADGSWLQHQFETRRTASDVITGEQLAALKRGLGADEPERTRPSQIVAAIEREGMYAGEFSSMIDRVNSGDKGSYSDRIAAWREAMKHIRKRGE